MFNSRERCSSPFPSHRASVLSKDNLPWSHGQCDLDTEHCYLPTEVVPIYLLAFACFRTARLTGAGTSNGSSLRRMDSILRLLTLQHRGFCGLTQSDTTSSCWECGSKPESWRWSSVTSKRQNMKELGGSPEPPLGQMLAKWQAFGVQ